MHPSIHSVALPEKPAIVMAHSGRALTYAALDARSNQGAQLFRSLGLRAGDKIALLLENRPEFFEIAWAAQRSGLYFVPISTKLQAGEVDYILADSGAMLLVTSRRLAEGMAGIAATGRLPCFSVDRDTPGFRDFGAERDAQPASPVADAQAGYDMLYSSGTTGKPKGIKPQALSGDPITTPDGVYLTATTMYGATEDTVYLCPAPVYHAAPLRWCMAMMRLGATVILMESFDAAQALDHIDRYRVTIAQFVPTHFIRMLKLPEKERLDHDLSSLQTVVHAAAPCPIPVKEAMLDWLGPIVHEYYSGSEGIGATFIGPADWLKHKGSVGIPVGTNIHICDEEGEELPPRSEGMVYFSGGPSFEYHNDPEKTEEARHPKGWATLGDIGWVDEDGFLYLTDRKSFMIISGGVNIYPQEIENHLVTHPKVVDVAVIGVPDDDMGEKVVAVVQPIDLAMADDALAAELMSFARASLSHVKAPRRIDFVAELPRQPTGKLHKRLIRDSYWKNAGEPQ